MIMTCCRLGGSLESNSLAEVYVTSQQLAVKGMRQEAMSSARLDWLAGWARHAVPSCSARVDLRQLPPSGAQKDRNDDRGS
jgi:hypothetical protein